MNTESSPVNPFRSNYIEIDGYQMHYLDEGSGPTVVLLHGNPTWCYLYRHVIKALRTKFRLVVPDQLGCGLSSRPDRVLRFRERVDQLKIFLDRLNIDDFSLVMHDWGGPIGSAMAMDRFPALRRLVYFNTTLTEVASLPKLIRWSAAPLVGRFLTQWSDRFIRFTTELGVVKPLSSQDRAGYFWPYPDSRSRRAIYDFVQDIPFTAGHPSWKDLELLRSQLVKLSSLPVQIIWGLKDPCFHKLMLERVAAHFPKAEVHSFEDASHLVLEDKASEVAVLLDEFLSRPNVV